jgi:hypothetical protein
MPVLTILKNSLIASLILSLFTVILSLPRNNLTILGTTNDLTGSAIISLTNLAREGSGLEPLTPHPALINAAQQKADHMVSQNYFSHKVGEFNPAWDFIAQEGYFYSQAGENLARDFSRSETLLDAWISSAPHRANILSNDYHHIGVAIAYSPNSDKNIIVQLFASPQSPGLLEKSVQYNDTPLLVSTSTIISRVIILVSILIAATISLVTAIKPPHKRSKKKKSISSLLWRS